MTAPEEPKGFRKAIAKLKANWKIYLIEFLILVICGFFIWNYFSDRSAEKERERREAEMKGNSADAALQTAIGYSRMASLGISMAIREQIILQNLGNVATTMNYFIRMKGMQRIFLADTDQKISAATDKSAEGKPFAMVFPGIDFPENDPEPYLTKSGSIRTFTAIRDQFGKEILGTVIVEYDFAVPDIAPAD